VLNLFISVTKLKVKSILFPSIGTINFFVNWTPPDGKGNFIHEYRVEWGDGNVMYLSGTERSANLSTGIVPGTKYTVSVTSINTKTEDGANRTATVTQEQSASE